MNQRQPRLHSGEKLLCTPHSRLGCLHLYFGRGNLVDAAKGFEQRVGVFGIPKRGHLDQFVLLVLSSWRFYGMGRLLGVRKGGTGGVVLSFPVGLHVGNSRGKDMHPTRYAGEDLSHCEREGAVMV
ncbi:hypothetical protein FS749_009762 [Ceratobasidium sp. UAMH 11750]|nr:hypothetical protein FS749_009762 [Ceratobasidium sp. UAMH 11750]